MVLFAMIKRLTNMISVNAISLVYLSLIYFSNSNSLVIEGEWRSGDSQFLFLNKFGFQKTIPHEGPLSEGYIYGNITSMHQEVPVGEQEAMLVLLPRQYFFNFYGNRSTDPDSEKNVICQNMFKEAFREAYDARCHDSGNEDFFRHIPCPEGKLCVDEDNPGNVLASSQLTFAIQNVNNPRFWYLSLVACRLNSSCGWQYSGPHVNVSYRLTLVNGKPPGADHDLFSYHFSCDRQGMGYLVLFCLFVYGCILLPLQFWVTYRQRMPVLEVFTSVLLLQTLSLGCSAVAQVIQGSSGIRFLSIEIVGEILLGLSKTLFLLLLLLLARGWAVTKKTTGHHTPLLYTVWSIYNTICFVLYILNKVLESVVEDTYYYSRWSGVVSLVLRGLITLWYLWELRGTMIQEQHPHTLHFLLQLGAASLVWLLYLPLVALIGLQVSPLWRHKLLAGFRFSADLLAHIFMAYILYPLRSDPYLALACPEEHCDELDLLDQAPHVLNRRRRRGIRLDSFGRKISGGSNELESDETVEFDKSNHETTDISSYGNGNLRMSYDYSHESASKYKVTVNRGGTQYMEHPLNRGLLGVTQQHSVTQLGPMVPRHGRGEDKPSSSTEMSLREPVVSLIDFEQIDSKQIDSNAVNPTDINAGDFSFDELSDGSESDVLVVVQDSKKCSL